MGYTKLIFTCLIQISALRAVKRIFHCCSACEVMKDYKGGYFMVWANYMSPRNSIAGLYIKGTCDAISVSMGTRSTKVSSKFQFL